MSGEMIKEFLVGLGFQVDEAGLAKFGAGISKATLTVTALGAAVTAAAGLVLAGVQKIAAEYDQLDKLATQFRDTADAIDEFVDASQILGISGDVAMQSLKDFDRAIIDTSMDMGRAKKVFEELGLSVKDAAGNLKPTTQVIAELQEKMQGMERGKQLRIMERLGLDPSLIKLFNADMAKLRAEMEAIDKAADFDFDTAVAEGKAFTKTWKELQQEIEKWKMLIGKAMESIAVKLMPGIRKSLKSAMEGMERFRRIVMENLPKVINTLTPIIQVIMRIAEAVVILAARFAQGVGTIIGWLVRVNEATNGWAGYILMAAAAWKYLNLAFLKTPIGQLLALAAVIALLIDDFLTWREDGDSLIDWGSGFGQVLQVVVGIVTALSAAFVASKVIMAAWAAGVAFVNTVMAAARIAMLAFNIAMWANPAVLIIGGIIAAVAALAAAAYLIYDNWGKIFAWFDEKITAMKEGIAGAWNTVKSTFGFGSASPASAPSPQAAAAVTGGNQNVSQNTVINVNGSGDPKAVAGAVAGNQNRVNADMARNMKGAAR